MTEQTIKQIETDGAKEKLYSEAARCLWTARQRLEDAERGRFEKADEFIREALTLIEDAHQLIKEYRTRI